MKFMLLPVMLAYGVVAAGQTRLFDSMAFYPVKEKVVSLKVKDINGDRHADILVMYNANSTRFGVLPGNDKGSFGSEQEHSKPVNYQRNDVADLNKDGFPDLVMSSYWDNGIRIFYGNDAGDFGTGQYFGTSVHGREVICADINKDGWDDIITTSSGSGNRISVHIFLNKGDGTFHPRKTYPTPLDTCKEIFVTDKNNDGLPDIVVTSAFPWVMFCYQQPDGSFVDKYLATNTAVKVGLADLNLDNREDLVLLYSSLDNMIGSDSMLVLLSTVDTAFARPFRVPQIAANKVRPSLLKLADINRDGFPDMVVNQLDSESAYEDTLFYLTANPGGGFNEPVAVPMPANVLQLQLEDVNNDGNPDIVAACDNNMVYVLYNTLSADNSSDGKLRVFPNPASGQLQVAGLGEGRHQIAIYDARGMLLQVHTTTAAVWHSNVARLPAGIYHLLVRDGNGRRTGRFRKY